MIYVYDCYCVANFSEKKQNGNVKKKQNKRSKLKTTE